MFVGHYAVSFWARSRDRTIPLWVLFLAVQFIDVLWAVFVLVGLEQYRLVPGLTEASPLDLYNMPWTHSLPGALAWSLLGAVLYRRLAAARWTSAAWVGFAVFSHWVLDLVVHRPDLPLWDNRAKVGFGLWNHVAWSFPLEIVLLAAAMLLWYRAVRGRVPGWRLLACGLVLALLQANGNFGRHPTSTTQFAVMALVFYSGLALASRWCDIPTLEPS